MYTTRDQSKAQSIQYASTHSHPHFTTSSSSPASSRPLSYLFGDSPSTFPSNPLPLSSATLLPPHPTNSIPSSTQHHFHFHYHQEEERSSHWNLLPPWRHWKTKICRKSNSNPLSPWTSPGSTLIFGYPQKHVLTTSSSSSLSSTKKKLDPHLIKGNKKLQMTAEQNNEHDDPPSLSMDPFPPSSPNSSSPFPSSLHHPTSSTLTHEFTTIPSKGTFFNTIFKKIKKRKSMLMNTTCFEASLKKKHPLLCFWNLESILFKVLETVRPDIPSSISQLRRTQTLLLQTLYYIYRVIPEPFLLPRNYLNSLPKDVQRLFPVPFSETTLFAAQAIVQFHPTSIPTSLYQDATYLVSTYVATLHVLHTLTDDPPYPNAWCVLKQMDEAWVQFESQWFQWFLSRCQGLPDCYLPMYLFPGPAHYEIIAVYISKSIQRLLPMYFTDFVQYAPILFILIPRWIVYLMASQWFSDPWLIHVPGCLVSLHPQLSTLAHLVQPLLPNEHAWIQSKLFAQDPSSEKELEHPMNLERLQSVFLSICQCADLFLKHQTSLNYSKILQLVWAWQLLQFSEKIKSMHHPHPVSENLERLKSISVSVSLYFYLRFYEQITGLPFAI